MGTDRRSRAAVVLVAALSCAFPVRAAQPENAADHPYNLLIFMVNCLSKSHVSLYGYDRKTTPNLDRFARDAYIFNNLVSPATWTPPVVQEFAGGKIRAPAFFLKDDWHWALPPLTDYPIAQNLLHRGYVYSQDSLPENGKTPFISFFHWRRTHYPYDFYRKHRQRLTEKERVVYDRILDGMDDIRLETSRDDDTWSKVETYMVFGARRTRIPAEDEALWNGILQDLKKNDGSSTAFIASRLPPALIRRLSQVQKTGQLSLQDKSAVVDALNGLVRNSDSPLREILFKRETTRWKDGPVPALLLDGGEYIRWEYFAANSIKQTLDSPDSFLSVRDGRLILRDRLNKAQSVQLRRIYRELLDIVIPSLAMREDKSVGGLPRLPLGKNFLDAWRNSPDYETELSLLKDLYDMQVEEADAAFGECLRRLKKEGVLDNTVVVFMGDHGEAFMEHGILEHTFSHCYDEVVNPPLVVRVPGALKKSVAVTAQLRTADVLPTLSALLGFPLPDTPDPLAGRNVASALTGADPGITAFSRDCDLFFSVRRGGWKLLWKQGGGQRMLYDLRSDPKELHNVAKDFPDRAVSLEEELNRFLYGN